MHTEIVVGRFTGTNKFVTANGSLKLSLAAPGEDPDSKPFADAREHEGYAVLLGVVKGRVLFNTRVKEVLPPIASRLLERYFASKRIDKGQLAEDVRAILRDIVGIPDPEPQPHDIVPSQPRPLVAIVVGHRKGAQGAENGEQNITEWAYNTEVAREIEKRVTKADVEIIFRDNRKEGYAILPAKINARNPQCVLSLHCNANDTTTSGTEMLCHFRSSEGQRFGRLLQEEVLKALKLKDRKVKKRHQGDRGFSLLRDTHAPCVIAEPFFIDNDTDIRIGIAKRARLAEAYARAIDAYADSIGTVPATPARNRAAARISRADAAAGLRFRVNISKAQFFTRNRGAWEILVDETNDWMRRRRNGANLIELTLEDAWSVGYAEAGVRGGRVNPLNVHSEGEHGIFPLPDKIRDWVGSDAPHPKKPMSVVRNARAFLRYLGWLKNTDVGVVSQGIRLYTGLFRVRGIAGNPAKEAQMLAAAVHGYFYAGAYTDKKKSSVATRHIVEGIVARKPISKTMASTRYIHGQNERLMKGREANLEAGLRLV